MERSRAVPPSAHEIWERARAIGRAGKLKKYRKMIGGGVYAI